MPPSIDINASAGRQTEGFIDVAHFAWIHHDSFAARQNPVVPQYSVERRDAGMRTEYVSTVSNFPKSMQHRAPDGFLWRRQFEVDVPFFARLTVQFPADGRLSILNAASPVSARKTRLFAPIVRNFDKDLPLEDVYAFNRQVFEEDRARNEEGAAHTGHLRRDGDGFATRRETHRRRRPRSAPNRETARRFLSAICGENVFEIYVWI